MLKLCSRPAVDLGTGCPARVFPPLPLVFCRHLHCRRTQALGPRRIPTAAAVDEELRKLRLEEGRPPSAPSSDDEGEGCGGRTKRRTALARDPPEYFAFVG